MKSLAGYTLSRHRIDKFTCVCMLRDDGGGDGDNNGGIVGVGIQ